MAAPAAPPLARPLPIPASYAGYFGVNSNDNLKVGEFEYFKRERLCLTTLTNTEKHRRASRGGGGGAMGAAAPPATEIT